MKLKKIVQTPLDTSGQTYQVGAAGQTPNQTLKRKKVPVRTAKFSGD
jgi:hypothetical protein